MARMAKVVELPSISKLNKQQGKVTAQLIQILREAVQQGDLKAGDPLPSSRELALSLSVSRGTIIEAYDQLLAEGVLEAHPRKGTFVAQSLINTPHQQHKKDIVTNTFKSNLTAAAQAYAEILKEFKPLPHLPFAISVPTGRTQPNDVWRKFGNRYRAQGEGLPSGYDDPQGVWSLRVAIAEYVRRSRSVHCQPEQIVITNGIQQALYICSQILFEPKDQVWLEDPAYRGTSAILENAVQNIQIVRVPVDEEGLQVNTAINLAPHARAAFVTPSHQYPMGMPMSLSRRHALLAWASQQQAWIIEDDYDSELRYHGQPFPALQGLAPERVIYLGTFSKVLFPSLRLGYAILPQALVAPFCGLRVLIDRHPASADQHVLAKFIEQGYLERHIRKIRQVYAENRQHLMTIIARHIPEHLGYLESGDQGMHMVLWLAEHINDLAIAQAAVDMKIAVKAISPTFSAQRKRSGLILGLGDFNLKQMESAVIILADLIQHADVKSASI
ncbi:PLP-dependent aminotransferase family protein [Acinetobacter bereziniae]|uniref:PLP-dependent aminotransferase family protein n=1 Tax=Acinetobacter bereziniae TaxID=106648 RepID=A0A8I1AH93_ACIBZ|nr:MULTISPECIES: PLP-dependent aminotransferase family protein [Acinetobacter]MBJ8453791.1 PLP-dependent aminotransferase family protein [Acinetobacter bereziniae]MBJ8457935.1 PLP-dependent aminotransferase family protein [Acinetobacter bereziniae]MDR3030595.1 PLP-dependent aminotransferase family protein [Acinetobacter sp.]NUF62245.1 PLP-dependent aminotransferase family protein [Acinetobacter bereziniae]NUG05972.1 PLP-dependent aminotransferase family protein [Acinetobacter bereziniae]